MVWNAGQQVFDGHYTIDHKLGEGGFGITYLARNPKGDLKVIKTLHERILNNPTWQPHLDKFRQDLHQEAAILFQCRHPHIVRVENHFDQGGLPCIAMEYIEGGTLREQMVQRGALPEAEALQYIQQVGDALTLVHGKGLLHRDIKPNNIMLRAGTGEAVLIDFGIAREFTQSMTQAHTALATPGYAPPEQYVNKAKRGEFTDVYALAATLYALLTGVSPVSALDRQGELHEQQPDPLKPLIQVNPKVSNQVSEAVMWGMALDYKQRPQSIQQWLAHLLGKSTTTCSATITLPPKKSKNLVLPNLRSTLLLSTIKGFSGKQSILKPIQSWVENHLKPLQKIKYWQIRNKWYLLSTPLVLLITLPLAYAYFSYKDFPLFSDPKLLTIRLITNGLYLERILTGRTSTGSKLIFRSDGQALALLADDSVQVWNFRTGELLKDVLVHQLRPQTSIKDEIVGVSPDFKYLVSQHDREVKVWDMNNFKQPNQTLTLKSGESMERISPIFKYLITSHGKQLKVWSLGNLNQPLHSLNLNKFGCLTVSNDSNYILSFDGIRSVFEEDLANISDKCESDRTVNSTWDLKTGKRNPSLDGMSRIANGHYFIKQEKDKTVILDLSRGEVHTLTFHQVEIFQAQLTLWRLIENIRLFSPLKRLVKIEQA